MDMINTNIMNEIFHLARNSSCYNKPVKDDYKITDLSNKDNNKYGKLQNIVNLDDKTDCAVVAFIKYKFLNKQFYIWAGQALLAIHSFEQFEINTDDPDNNVPSIKQVVARACFNLENKIGKSNQCIAISGESGSGKTFSACLAINHLAEFQTKKVENCNGKILVWQAWSSVPLLAAFGNAPTTHNPNSSRFGKLIQMQYEDGVIVGTYLQTYLLEKSRISGPNRGEGNFHIFCQILEYYDEKALNEIYLYKNFSYKIAPENQVASKWLHQETLKSMEILDITKINEILRILSVILNLGNVNFENTDCGYIVTDDSYVHFINVCKILLCNETELVNLFTKRLIAAKLRRGTFCYSSCLNVEECEDRKNSFMRFLYGKLFTWLVKNINKKICSFKNCNQIGILDIYGFESFTFNTFEQLCINYANERLHQYFVNDYLVKHMNDLKDDNDQHFTEINTSEYKERIDMMDGTISVFGILNEECLLKRYNSDSFVALRLKNSLKDCRHFMKRKYENCSTFSIAHYTGTVEYDCKNMLIKNRDKIPDEIIIFLQTCKLPFVNDIIDDEDADDKKKSILSKFKKSLDSLMSSLEKSDVHYVKCLKPNSNQTPGYFDEEFFKSQLNNNGILDILKLSLQNYSIKISKDDFTKNNPFVDLDILSKVKGNVHLGKRFIYLTYDSFRAVRSLNNIKKQIKGGKILKCWRNYRKRKEVDIAEHVKSSIQKTTKRNLFIRENIISIRRLPDVPIRFHARKTCIPNSNILPKSELPRGLPDIF